MKWMTPKIDWSPNDNVSYEDINRISGNINYLYQQEILKEDFTENDIVELSQWKAIVSAISELSKGVGVSRTIPDTDTTAENFNDVEELTFATKEMIDLIFKQTVANIYAGDDLYISDAPENYTRGV